MTDQNPDHRITREDRLKAHHESINDVSPDFERGNDRRQMHTRDKHSRHHHRTQSPRRGFDANYRERDTYLPNTVSTIHDAPLVIKEKPNFKPSGLLAKDSNNIKGIQLKYTEPDDSATPPSAPVYTLFIFKEDSKITRQFPLNTRSWHLIGRDEKVVHLETDHESCSKQHAAIQWRERPYMDSESGSYKKETKYV